MDDYDYMTEHYIEDAYEKHLTGIENPEIFFPTELADKQKLKEQCIAADGTDVKYIVVHSPTLKETFLGKIGLFEFHMLEYTHWKMLTESSRRLNLFILKREITNA